MCRAVHAEYATLDIRHLLLDMKSVVESSTYCYML